MKKRKLIILGVLLIVLMSMFAIVSNAVDTDDFIYTVEDGCAVITDYKGAGGDVIIPSTLDGYKVSRIGERAFEEIDTISTITMSDGITHIDDLAFCRVSATHINLSDSVVTIGDSAFAYCLKLQSIELSDNLETIGDGAFKCTSALKSVVLPDKITSLGQYVFEGSSIKKITLPDNLEKIPVYAFDGSNLTEITIPASVKEIATGAFNACYKLKTVTFLGNIEKIGKSAFAHCTKLESINIPDSVKEIEKDTFSCCFALAELKLPAKLEIIGESAFDNCVALTKIILPDTVSKIGYRAFAYCKKLQFVDFKNVKEIENEAFVNCALLEQVVFGTNLEKVGKSAFNLKLNWETIYVCYRGNEKQWDKISFDKNSTIIYAETHFNYTEVHETEYIITKATFNSFGEMTRKCKVCNYSEVVKDFFSPYHFSLSKSEYTYDGKVKTPTVTVRSCMGDLLEKDTDYKVTYEKGRTNPGKYSVRIDFIGNYEGTKRLYFTIAPKVTSKVSAVQSTKAIKLTWNKVTGADGYRVYQYNSKTKKWDNIKTTTATSYKVEKLSAGTAYKFRIKAYKKDDGTIWGKATPTFATATKCATPSLTKLTTSGGKVTFTWSNVSGESGFQVYYSTKKDSGYKKVTSYKANVLKGSKSKLTKGKTYYFKVRAYKKTDSGTVFSAWSPVKSIKVK